MGDRVPDTGSPVPTAAALLLTAYPLIDVVASLVAARGDARSSTLLRINSAISSLAVVAIAVAAFGFHAGAVLIAFGTWATVSGALQFGHAVRGRRTSGPRVLMLVSGGLSTIAGINFAASARMHDPHLALLGGYMALGGVLFLLSAAAGRSALRRTR